MSESKLELPKITDTREDNGILNFTISTCNVSVVNSIRRTILSDIPVVAFKTEPHNEVNSKLESTIIFENTSTLTNEIIKQRMGCIPVHIKDPKKMFIENLVVEIDVHNDSENMLYVTTEDFKIKEMGTNSYLKDSEVKKIFPKNKITNDFILFNRLKPKISKFQKGEILKIHAKLDISTSKINSQHNVCSTIGYENTIDNVRSIEAWMKYKDIIEGEGKKPSEIKDIEKNWFNHNAKRYFIPNSFDFKLESIGIYRNEELIKMSCNILINRMEELKTLFQANNIEIQKDTLNTKYSFDIILPNVSYTLGKMLEYLLHDRYFEKNNIFSYVGFIKKHPHDDDSIIRIVFKNGDKSNIDNIKSLFIACINYSQDIYSHINESFI
jgi:hypothetical protein